MYKDQEILSILFDIGTIEYYTFQYDLPENVKFEYLKRFKKVITVSEFDQFCSSGINGELKSKALESFDIKCPIPFYYDLNRFTTEREKDVQFSRDLKIKLLCQ